MTSNSVGTINSNFKYFKNTQILIIVMEDIRIKIQIWFVERRNEATSLITTMTT